MNLTQSFYERTRKKYNKAIKAIKDKSISNLRSKIRILIVDDDNYPIADLLRTRGYHLFYKNDIEFVEESEPYDIVILDIKGVGKNFKGTLEGLSYAKEVKLHYPHKIVVCYSGTSSPSISEQLDKVDGFIQKDTDIDRWVQKLDDYILKFSNIEYHWEIIRNQLEKASVSQKDIFDIEKFYKDSFNNDNFDSLKNNFMDKVKDIGLLMDVLKSLITLIGLFT